MMTGLIESRERLRDGLDALVGAISVPIRAGHVAYLDGWRGICILLVLLGHYLTPLGSVGSAGVEFFFALSGALMAELLVFRKQAIGIFLRRRLSRVVPALAVYVALVGLALNVSLWRQGLPLNLASPFAALFYFHNYLPHDQVALLFEHSWSLSVEEHSYLLLVGIVVAARRRPLVAAATALAISALAVGNAYRLAALPYDGGQFIFWRSDVRAASVLLSFALCIMLRQFNPQRVPGWVAVAAAVAALVGMSEPAIGPLRLAVSSLFAAIAVNALTYCSERFRAPLTAPVLVWFGTLSFSIYVWQQLFASLGKFGAPTLTCLAMTLVCAILSFRLVENPARDYLNAHWGRRDAQPQRDLS